MILDLKSFAKKRTPSALLKYGLPMCLFSLFLACTGSSFMRLAVLSGAFVALWVVKKRAVYPFGLILRSSHVTASPNDEPEYFSMKLDHEKVPFVKFAFAWFAFLLMACAISMFVPAFQVDCFSGPDIIDRITKISFAISLAVSHIGGAHKSAAVSYSFVVVHVFDIVVLLSLCLFSSITGSACLYWFFIYSKTGN